MASHKIAAKHKFKPTKGTNGKCKTVRLSDEERRALEEKYNQKSSTIFDNLDLSTPEPATT